MVERISCFTSISVAGPRSNGRCYCWTGRSVLVRTVFLFLRWISWFRRHQRISCTYSGLTRAMPFRPRDRNSTGGEIDAAFGNRHSLDAVRHENTKDVGTSAAGVYAWLVCADANEVHLFMFVRVKELLAWCYDLTIGRSCWMEGHSIECARMLGDENVDRILCGGMFGGSALDCVRGASGQAVQGQHGRQWLTDRSRATLRTRGTASVRVRAKALMKT